MTSASPNPARGAQPGKHQRPKRSSEWPPSVRWTRLPTGPSQPTFWWDANGRLFLDKELTEPTRYRIVEFSDGDPETLASIVLGVVDD